MLGEFLGMGGGKAHGPQNAETIMGLFEVGMGINHDNTGVLQLVGRFAADGGHFGIHRCDAKVVRISDFFRHPA